jgi:predicted HAD superfamily hydrolase
LRRERDLREHAVGDGAPLERPKKLLAARKASATGTVTGRLITAIDRYEILSLDVFDTSIVRRVGQPTDVFELVAGQYRRLHGPEAAWDFAGARVGAERRARERAWAERHAYEVTLDEIYACLDPPDGWSSPALRALEVDLERLVCTRNEAVQKIYQHARELGKKVVFVSDTYLPEEIVEQILRTEGYPEYARLFVSSAFGTTKSSGQLYSRMLNELSVPPERILHVGDDFNADVRQAQSAGLAAFHYQRAPGRAPDPSVAADAAAAIHRGLVNHRSAADGREDFFEHLGYACAGVLYLGFQRWLKAELERAEIERVFFLARDGWIMSQVYNRIGGGPPSAYLYGSRRAFMLPAITELDDPTLRFLSAGRPLEVGQYLKRIGLDPEQLGDVIARAGFAGPTDRVRAPVDTGRVRSLFRLVEPQIRAVAEHERDVTLEYLRQSGLSTARRVAVVDLGWQGTQQRALVKLLKLAGAEVSVDGYYLGTFEQARVHEAEGLKLHGWLFEFGQPAEFRNLINTCCEILEFIHCAPHGPVLGFERKGDTIVPVFATPEVPPTQLEAAERLQSAALAYIDDFSALAKRLPWLVIKRELGVAPLVRVLTRPTGEEAQHRGDLLHSDGFGGQIGTPIARPPGPWELVLHPTRVVSGLERSFWRAGYVRRLVGASPRMGHAVELAYRLVVAIRARFRGW